MLGIIARTIVGLVTRVMIGVGIFFWSRSEVNKKVESANAKAAISRLQTSDNISRLDIDARRKRLRQWSTSVRGVEADKTDKR